MTAAVDLWTIQILEDEFTPNVAARLPALMAEIEENLTLLLPDGCSAKIRRWDDPNPGEDNDDDNDR